MSAYSYGPAHGPGGYGDRAHGGLDPEGLVELAEHFLQTLRAEYPGLAGYGEIIKGELELAAEDGGPPNRGRIRNALEVVCISALAGTGSLGYVQQFTHLLDL
ncbi:hypothetical protein [Streptomyces sp. NK08204]|uniref:hypothetical protein n=1 Tax=Streptomyces sp. NK08204 TaxID=2873260 RepID=UPI001CEDCF67|nr:hypothetical protein [Streptomyces sp. NK08204]